MGADDTAALVKHRRRHGVHGDGAPVAVTKGARAFRRAGPDQVGEELAAAIALRPVSRSAAAWAPDPSGQVEDNTASAQTVERLGLCQGNQVPVRADDDERDRHRIHGKP